MHTKSFTIPIDSMINAWKEVKSNSGSCGVDGVTLATYETNLKKNLYKLWNRMSSGSYFPQAMKIVPIPKKQGGERILGIPTVEDRIAQTVVKMVFEKQVEPIFYEDSYGYRPNKSALGAISVTRKRCWKWDWVLEYDIKGLFDNIDHNLLMRAVKLHTKEKWVILYVQRWLIAPYEGSHGMLSKCDKGVPQGGVISPLLANLFLHYVLDHWLNKNYPKTPWCRYSDDGLLHCRTKQEAVKLLADIKQRFAECKLTLHPDKTRIIYCKDEIRNGSYQNTSFDFLGYCFRSRRARNHSESRNFSGFNPAISKSAKKGICTKIRSWKIIRKTGSNLQEIANKINPILRGWVGYYGRYYASELNRVFSHLNKILVRWLMRKYSKLRKHKIKAWMFMAKLAKEQPHLFVHWKLGIVGAFA